MIDSLDLPRIGDVRTSVERQTDSKLTKNYINIIYDMWREDSL